MHLNCKWRQKERDNFSQGSAHAPLLLSYNDHDSFLMSSHTLGQTPQKREIQHLSLPIGSRLSMK